MYYFLVFHGFILLLFQLLSQSLSIFIIYGRKECIKRYSLLHLI
jgi:hypothetical protein